MKRNSFSNQMMTALSDSDEHVKRFLLMVEETNNEAEHKIL
jgi:hypothetical protein